MVSLYNGDCLKVMKQIPDESVDLILCDLPYGTTGSEWDKVIPPNSLWEHYRRILKHNGTVVLFATEPFATKMRFPALDIYKYDWIWKKRTTTGFAHAKSMPLRDYENIMVFSKGKVDHKGHSENRMEYNPQGLTDCHVYGNTNRDTKVLHSASFRKDSDKYLQTKTGYPKMVLEFQKERTDSKFHVNAKPVDLLEYLVRTYTNEGGVVLDNCMGSGSTGVACVNTRRNFIGIELNEDYFTTAQKRIKEAENSRATEPV